MGRLTAHCGLDGQKLFGRRMPVSATGKEAASE